MFGLIPFDRRRNQVQTTNPNNDRTWDIDRVFENFFNDAIFPSYYNRSSFNIENIDTDNIKAKMENGVLMLKLPKREPDKKAVRKIDIG